MIKQLKNIKTQPGRTGDPSIIIYTCPVLVGGG